MFPQFIIGTLLYLADHGKLNFSVRHVITTDIRPTMIVCIYVLGTTICQPIATIERNCRVDTNRASVLCVTIHL